MSRLHASNIPTWRKAVFLCGFFATLTLGGVLANKEFDFYVSRPKSPTVSTGETYRISVNHGAVRYLTAKDYENYEAWKARFCLPMLPAILALITSREFWRSVRGASA